MIFIFIGIFAYLYCFWVFIKGLIESWRNDDNSSPNNYKTTNKRNYTKRTRRTRTKDYNDGYHYVDINGDGKIDYWEM